MVLQRYVIVEEPTAQEPTKYPRLVGRTSNTTAAAANCAEGEILLACDYGVTLDTWQREPFHWYAGIPGQEHMTEDITLHQRRWIVEYNGGNYQITETDPPFISKTYCLAQITGSLTIT